jgi:hypothetical protein
MCTGLLPPGVNPIAVKYIISPYIVIEGFLKPPQKHSSDCLLTLILKCQLTETEVPSAEAANCTRRPQEAPPSRFAYKGFNTVTRIIGRNGLYLYERSKEDIEAPFFYF